MPWYCQIYIASVFTLIETIWSKIWAKLVPKNSKSPLLVDVCCSKTSSLTLPSTCNSFFTLYLLYLPIWFTDYNMSAIRIEVNSVKYLASKLLDQCWVINLLLRCHDWQLELERGWSTCFCLIQGCSIQKVNRLRFLCVLDLEADGRGSRCWAGHRWGRLRSDGCVELF